MLFPVAAQLQCTLYVFSIGRAFAEIVTNRGLSVGSVWGVLDDPETFGSHGSSSLEVLKDCQIATRAGDRFSDLIRFAFCISDH